MCTTYVIQLLLLQRLPLFVLQGNFQVDGGSLTYNVMGALDIGQKLIAIMKEDDFFKDTKMYDDEM